MKVKYFLITLLLIIFCVGSMPGCAGYYKTQQAYYKTQQELIKAQYGFGSYYHLTDKKSAVGDTFKVELDDNQRVKSFSANLEPIVNAMRPPKRELALVDVGKPQNHPVTQWWKDTIYSPVAQIVAGFWGAAHFADVIGSNAGNNTTNTNSGNTGSYNESAGDMGISTGAGSVDFDQSTVTTTDNSTIDSNDDMSDNSISDSNNDMSDNSAVDNTSDSYNDSRSDYDNQQDTNDSYNDSRENYDNDNRSDYDNPVDDNSSSSTP